MGKRSSLPDLPAKRQAVFADRSFFEIGDGEQLSALAVMAAALMDDLL